MSEVVLHDIAKRAGVERGFRDVHGNFVEASPQVLAAVLKALGYDVTDDAACERTLADLRRSDDRLVSATIPLHADEQANIPVRADGGEVHWRVELEGGGRREGRSPVLVSDVGHSRFSIENLPAGYHRLEVSIDDRHASATLVAAPETCFLPPALADDSRGFGLTAQVYGLRSTRNFGFGDLGDVGDMGEGAARFGASFLGLSPLHALFPADRSKVSPYSPSSRLFIDPIFIDPTLLPDFAGSDAARYLADPDVAASLQRLREADLVDHSASWAIKRAVLGRYWSRTANGTEPAFAAFREDRGEALEWHALFEALSEHFATDGKVGVDAWPEPYRDAGGEAVKRWRDANPMKVAFHAWLQWIADEQLAIAQARACEAGMPVGLYRDLAVGIDRGGAELWARPDWFVPGVAVGAPPDLFQPDGQVWGLPPFNPRTLEEQGLLSFRTMVAANMRHAGAIRIDHAFQIQRLYVVPDGNPGRDGVYINYPFEALLAVLRIESHRARTLVIAEDLGTSPDGFSDSIMHSDILSYRILSFEREGEAFKPPSAYPRKALAALATHDLPTFAGWWKGLDTDLRESFGFYSAEQAAKERDGRVGEKEAFARALHDADALSSPYQPARPPLDGALRFLAKSPCMLVALQLEDVLHDEQQANLPGPDRGHPNWRRKLRASVDAILAPNGELSRSAAVFLQEGRGVPGSAEAAKSPIPTSTYRLQFHKDFTFADAIEALPFIASFGISHIYASPIFKARPGSTHGYDVVDPTRINPELGGLDAFERFSAAVKQNGMSLLIDIVPNHMGVGGSENPWWLSVLEWGELSPFADTFDVDWDRLGAHGKLVAPNLGGQYGDVLEKGELNLDFDAESGGFAVTYFEHLFPICPLTYPDILDRANAAEVMEAGQDVAGLIRLGEELRALAADPADRRGDVVAICNRHKHKLATLAKRPEVMAAIERALTVFNGTPGLPESFGPLHRLLERQAYRLSYWRVAASDVNYRRFFDIDSLAGVRIENPVVFERTHALIFDLIGRGLVQGLRVDHIDGLADPKAYAAALQRKIGPNFYIVVEKILEPGERLRPWAIAGTSGYEMLNLIDGVFVEADHEKSFDRVYRETTGFTQSYEEALLSAKRQVLLESFSSELESLVSDVKRIADANRLTRDYSVNAIRIALGDFVCAFPVYRTYLTPNLIEADDRILIDDVIEKAKTITDLPDRSVHEFLGSILLGTLPMGRRGRAAPALVDRFRRRFQQLTGPVMAKSLEDTLFYRYVRFLALNEVGGEPSRFGVPLADFHAENKARVEHWPHALVASSTHDTKRGEDARARLLALSEVPDLWTQALALWKTEVGTIDAPDANDQYMILQALLGAWPLELLTRSDAEAIAAFRERIATFIPKALREAKRHSKWTEPNDAYEQAAANLMERLLADGSCFIDRLRPILQDLAERGMLVGLSRTILKCTVPGVPDFYQGTGLFDFSLVDPDNRRAVRYEERDTLIKEGDRLRDLFGRWQDGAIKLRLTADLLRDRADHQAFYADADYKPLTVTGTRWQKVIAFSRSHEGRTLVVVVPRAAGSGSARPVLPIGDAFWTDTTVELAAGEWCDVFESRHVRSNGSIPVASLLADLPFAVFRSVA